MKAGRSVAAPDEVGGLWFGVCGGRGEAGDLGRAQPVANLGLGMLQGALGIRLTTKVAGAIMLHIRTSL